MSINPAPPAPPALPPATRPPAPRRRVRPLSQIHPSHPFWGKIIRIMAALWHVIWWVVGAVIIGGIIVNFIISYIISGTIDLSNVETWALFRFITSHPLASAFVIAIGPVVALLAFLANRSHETLPSENQSAEYVMRRVSLLQPEQYVPRYVGGVYLSRRKTVNGVGLDIHARQVLREADRVDRSSASSATTPTPLGVCIFGRPTQGKTRFAWEAMQSELRQCTLVKWPHDPQHAFNFASLRGRHVLLWLDDLQEYANPSEAPTVNDLPRRFADAGVRLIILATCRDGDDETVVHTYLDKLLDRLSIIRLEDISQAEADDLAHQLSTAGVEVQRDQFDKTPGSLLLGVRRMRTERYPKLPDDARRVLRALKLLRSARIFIYTATRVRGTAVDVFHMTEENWNEALRSLVSADFLRLRGDEPLQERGIEPVADVYLDEAVPDYPIPGADVMDDWPNLASSLISQRDATALVSLGNAYDELAQGNSYSNKQQAVQAYRAALELLPRERSPMEWALAQSRLGNGLVVIAQGANLEQRGALLGEAMASLSAALQIYSPDGTPQQWSTTQRNLGTAYKIQAELTEGEARTELLKQAVEAYSAALNAAAAGPNLDGSGESNGRGTYVNRQALLTRTLDQMDPDLRRVFIEDILDLLGSLDLAISQKRVRINDVERFRYFYIRTLKSFPNTTFIATSLTSQHYFWGLPTSVPVEDTMVKFMRDGGSIRRIFYISKGDESLPEVRDVLQRQYEIGVDVYYIDPSAVAPELVKLFFSEANGRIGWEIFVDQDQYITLVDATTDQHATQELVRVFQALLKAGARRYRPGES